MVPLTWPDSDVPVCVFSCWERPTFLHSVDGQEWEGRHLCTAELSSLAVGLLCADLVNATEAVLT